LLAGDYDAGIRTRKKHTDEISTLEDLANQVSERIRTYDSLRAARVSIHSRALELLLLQSRDAIVTANVEKEIFVFNPVAQRILGVQRKSFSFESVLKPSANEAFSKLFHQAVAGRKTNAEGPCFLQLPGMQAPARLTILMMPLRDRDETVRFAVLFIDPSGEPS
jgi:PAS domain-containing protein